MEYQMFYYVIVSFALLVDRSVGFTNMADVECGVARARSGKVVNGEDATDGEFPWMASLVGLRGENFCGGALIHKKWILTAAHCIIKELSQFRISLTGPTMARTNDIDPPSKKGDLLINPSRIVIHDSYSPSRSKIADDIALIMLEREVDWTSLVQPICLPVEDKETYNGSVATVAGWGFTNELKNGGKRPKRLQKLNVPVLDNEVCQRWYTQEKKSIQIVSGSMCAGFELGGKDACQGDSGGPLVVKKEGRSMVIGVVSAGIGCARPRLPGIYTRVSNYVNWINEVLSK